MNWIANNLNWLIYVAVFVIPVVSSVGKWLQQQAAKKQAEAQQRRRADAELRTGRADPNQTVPESGAQQASRPATSTEGDEDPPETFADRRRRQIEELKRRQEAAQRQRDAAQRTSPSPAPAPAPVPTPAPRPVERRRVQPTPGPVLVAAPRVEQPSDEVESLAAKFERQAGAQRRAAQAKRPASDQSGPLRVGPGLDRATLRKAVVLSEVLAPPVGMRDNGQRAV